jgi:hypothetical protein
VTAFAALHNIWLLTIPAGMTSTYQPLDTHINGIIKAKLASWTHGMVASGLDVTLYQRKNAVTLFLRKLKAVDVRNAFDESLVANAQAPRPAPPADLPQQKQRARGNKPFTAQLMPITNV